jgi:hypothetical protein
VHKVLTPLALSSLDAALETECSRVINALQNQSNFNSQSESTYENSIDAQKLFMQFTCNIVLEKSLGITFVDENDAIFKMICDSILEVFHLAGVGGLEDYFPNSIIGKLIVWPKRKAMDRIKSKFHNGLIINQVKQLHMKIEDEKNEGKNPRDRDLCYAEELILSMDQENLSLEDIKLIVVDFLSAGIVR